jgi:outer membrane protein insertion porin family
MTPDPSNPEQSRKLKIAQLLFQGRPVLTIAEQQEIGASLMQRDYDDAPASIEELLVRARYAWQERGYFLADVGDAQIRKLQETPAQTTVAISVPIEAGQQYRLQEIRFSKTTQFTNLELRSMFPIRERDIFDISKLQQGVENLRAAYEERGFINFTAIPEVKTDQEQGTAIVNFEMDEGSQFRLHKIKARGLNPSVLTPALHDAGVEPGNIFNAANLEKLYKALRPMLPAGWNASDLVERAMDERKATVDLLMDFCEP